MWLLKQIVELVAIVLMIAVGGMWLMVGFWFIQSWWDWIKLIVWSIVLLVFVGGYLLLIITGIWNLFERQDYFPLMIIAGLIFAVFAVGAITKQKKQKSLNL